MALAHSRWRSSAPLTLLVLTLCVPAKTPTPSPTTAATVSSLEATIRARLDSLPAHSTFYAKQLSTGREVAIRADEPMNTASVIKIPVMILAFRDADAGKLNLE